LAAKKMQEIETKPSIEIIETSIQPRLNNNCHFPFRKTTKTNEKKTAIKLKFSSLHLRKGILQEKP